jgi:hypothetical protein
MELIEEQLIIGEHYLLKNGVKTGPLRYSNSNTRYVYEANIPQEDGPDYIFQFLKSGKYLTDDVEHRWDIDTSKNKQD